MISKSATLFLEKKVDFYFISDFPKESFKEKDMDIFNTKAVDKSIAFIWADVLSEILIEKVGNVSYEQVIIIISDKKYNLRRVESLLGTRISRIYLYSGNEFNYDDIFTLCTETGKISKKIKNQDGIKRILNINFKVHEGKKFICVFKDNCFIESPKNVKIACLQLKGKRASGIFMENLKNVSLNEISKMLPKTMSNQVLINFSNLSKSDLKMIETSETTFQQVNVKNGGDIVSTLNNIDLPLLNEMVWDKGSYLSILKLNKLLSNPPISSEYFAIAGDINDKVERKLDIFEEVILGSSYQSKSGNTLMFYKNKILQKKYIFLNHKDGLVQQDLLRMLLTAGQNKYDLIAIGNKNDYKPLIQLYEEMMKKNFYQSRELNFTISSVDELLEYIESKLNPIIDKKMEQVEEKEVLSLTEDDIIVRKKKLFQLEKQFRHAFSKFIGLIINDYMQLSSVIVISDKESGKMITNAIMELYRHGDDIGSVFKDRNEKKKFHFFLKSITPNSSKTEFPENTEELILIIKSLIFKILGSFFNDRGNVIFIKKKINLINLKINPLEKIAAKLKKAVQFNSQMIQEVHDTEFLDYLLNLKKKCEELEIILIELLLQYNFVLLAVPLEMKPASLINSFDLRQKEKRDKIQPFQELKLMINEIDFLMK